MFSQYSVSKAGQRIVPLPQSRFRGQRFLVFGFFPPLRKEDYKKSIRKTYNSQPSLISKSQAWASIITQWWKSLTVAWKSDPISGTHRGRRRQLTKVELWPPYAHITHTWTLFLICKTKQNCTYMYESFLCIYVWVSFECLVPTEGRREHHSPWDCSYRWL